MLGVISDQRKVALPIMSSVRKNAMKYPFERGDFKKRDSCVTKHINIISCDTHKQASLPKKAPKTKERTILNKGTNIS